MSVCCFLGAIVAAAFGVWWLAAMLFAAGLMLAGIDVFDERDRRRHADVVRRLRLMAEVRRHD
jgi:hypothetical protein